MEEQSQEQEFDWRALVKQRRHWYAKWWGIALLLLLALVGSFAVALGFSVKEQIKRLKTEHQQLSYGLPTVELLPADELTPTLGAEKPLYEITVWSDFGCPYCKKEAPVLRQLVSKRSREIRLVYKDYIATENSIELALAARCAHDQGMFWPMHDYLFEHQGEELIPMLIDGTKELKLNLNDFYLCLKTEKRLPQLKRDMAERLDLNLTGTPTIIINGLMLPPGDPSLEYLEEFLLELKNKQLKQ
jgi:protein-disulfide isomerase